MVIMNREFLTEFYGEGPRKGGMPNQFMLKNIDWFFEFYKDSIVGNFGCYISINPFTTLDMIVGVEKLYFDFDKEQGVDEAFKEFRIFSRSIEKKFNVKTLKTFSGNKGYNLYLYLPEIVKMPLEHAKIFNRTILNTLIEDFLDDRGKLTLNTFDIGCTKDPARIGRVPFSIHQKSNMMCKVIFTSNPIKTLKEAKAFPISQELVDETIKKVEGILILRELNKEKFSKSSWRNMGGIRRCILEALDNPNIVGGADHQNRIAFVLDAKRAGWNVDRIVGRMSNKSDFDMERTKNAVEDLISRNYENRTGCETLIRLGICDNQCGKRNYKPTG